VGLLVRLSDEVLDAPEPLDCPRVVVDHVELDLAALRK
jgi:hypothetical protein